MQCVPAYVTDVAGQLQAGVILFTCHANKQSRVKGQQTQQQKAQEAMAFTMFCAFAGSHTPSEKIRQQPVATELHKCRHIPHLKYRELVMQGRMPGPAWQQNGIR